MEEIEVLEEEMFKEIKPLIEEYKEYADQEIPDEWYDTRIEASKKREERQYSNDIEGEILQALDEEKSLDVRRRLIKELEEVREENKKLKRDEIYKKVKKFINSNKKSIKKEIEEKTAELDEIKEIRNEAIKEKMKAYKIRKAILEQGGEETKAYTAANEETKERLKRYREINKQYNLVKEELELIEEKMAKVDERYSVIDFKSDKGIYDLLEFMNKEQPEQTLDEQGIELKLEQVAEEPVVEQQSEAEQVVEEPVVEQQFEAEQVIEEPIVEQQSEPEQVIEEPIVEQQSELEPKLEEPVQKLMTEEELEKYYYLAINHNFLTPEEKIEFSKLTKMHDYIVNRRKELVSKKDNLTQEEKNEKEELDKFNYLDSNMITKILNEMYPKSQPKQKKEESIENSNLTAKNTQESAKPIEEKTNVDVKEQSKIEKANKAMEQIVQDEENRAKKDENESKPKEEQSKTPIAKIVIGRKGNIKVGDWERKIGKETIKKGARLATSTVIKILEKNGVNLDKEKIEEAIKENVLDPVVINILREVGKDKNVAALSKDIMTEYCKNCLRENGKLVEVEYNQKDLSKASIIDSLVFKKEVNASEKYSILTRANQARIYGFGKLTKNRKGEELEYKPGIKAKVLAVIKGEKLKTLPTMGEMHEAAILYDQVRELNLNDESEYIKQSRYNNDFVESIRITDEQRKKLDEIIARIQDDAYKSNEEKKLDKIELENISKSRKEYVLRSIINKSKGNLSSKTYKELQDLAKTTNKQSKEQEEDEIGG